jgi:hypothetical protein
LRAKGTGMNSVVMKCAVALWAVIAVCEASSAATTT